MKAKLFQLLEACGDYRVEARGNAIWLQNKSGDAINIIFIDETPDEDFIREAYRSSIYQLFIVSIDVFENAIESVTDRLPNWLRWLHGLHYGRIYVMDETGDEIWAVHWNREDEDVDWYGPIPEHYLIDLEYGGQDSWLHDFSGLYPVAKFGDGTWWKAWQPKTEEEIAEEQREKAEPKDPRWNFYGGPRVTWDHNPYMNEYWRDFSEAFKKEAERMQQETRTSGRSEWTFRHQAPPKESEEQRKAREAQWEAWANSFGGDFFRAATGSTGRARGPYTNENSNVGSSPPPGRVMGLARHYAVLGVPDYSDLDTSKAAYRELARKYHPDMNDAPDATEKMQAINEAWDAIRKALS